jgi:hypothetical protein
MGHTTGAVGAVLAAFMGGLAMGAWLAGRATSNLEPARALRIYAVLETAIAICALAMPFAIGALRPLLAWAYADGSGGALFGLTRLVVSVAVIALPGAAMGASFPVGVCVLAVGSVRVRGVRGVRKVRGVRIGAIGAKGARGAKGAKGAGDVAELYAANTIVLPLVRRSRDSYCCLLLVCSARLSSESY